MPYGLTRAIEQFLPSLIAFGAGLAAMRRGEKDGGNSVPHNGLTSTLTVSCRSSFRSEWRARSTHLDDFRSRHARNEFAWTVVANSLKLHDPSTANRNTP